MNFDKLMKVFLQISISIILLTTLGLVGTFLTDYLNEINWFGNYQELNWSGSDMVEVKGARWHWYAWGLGTLWFSTFAHCAIRIINSIDPEAFKDKN